MDLRRVSKSAATHVSHWLGQLPAPTRAWKGLDEIHSATLLVTQGLGMGDLLMASALFKPLLSRGIRVSVAGSKYPAFLKGIPHRTPESLRDDPSDLYLIPDFSLRNMQYFRTLRRAKYWIGYPYDWRLRACFEAKQVNDFAPLRTHWQDRVRPLAEAIGANWDYAYHSHLIEEPVVDTPEKFFLLNLVTDQSVRGLNTKIYRQIFDSLLSRGLVGVLVGDRRFEKTVAGSEWSHPAVISKVGKTSVHQLNWLTGKSLGYIGIDSGPMHVAFALRKPAFAIFKGVLPEWRRPLSYGPEEVFEAYCPCAFKGTSVCYDPVAGFPPACQDCSEKESFSAMAPALDRFLERVSG